MSETPANTPALNEETAAVVAPTAGPVSQWLQHQGFEHEVLEPDHVGIEQIGVDASVLPIIAAALKSNGFDYLQCHGGYDEGRAAGGNGIRPLCFIEGSPSEGLPQP